MNDDPDRWQRLEHAFEEMMQIERRHAQPTPGLPVRTPVREPRGGPQPAIDFTTDISKQAYLMRLLQGVGSGSTDTKSTPISQADLSAKIRAGARFTYASDSIFEEVWK